MESLYKHHSKPSDFVPEELFRGVLKTLDSAVSVEFQNEYPELCKLIADNNEVFAAFKVHDQCERMARLLTGEDGQLRSFREWAKLAEPIADHHNRVWLRTEYDTAVKRAQLARDWTQFREEKDVFPNLRWVPSTAVTPGADHIVFWNTVRPVDDAFWSAHRPGDRWGCQCSLEATDDPATDVPDTGDVFQAPDPGLDNNPADDGRLFSDSHPYFPDSCATCPFNTGGHKSGTPKNMANDCRHCLYLERIIDDKVKITGVPTKYEDFGEGWKKEFQINGGYLVTEIGRIPEERNGKKVGPKWEVYKKEHSMCVTFANAGHRVVHLKEREGLYDVLFDDKPADLKKTGSLSSLDKYISHALRDQKAEVVLLELKFESHDVHTKLDKYRRAGLPIYYYFSGREAQVHKL